MKVAFVIEKISTCVGPLFQQASAKSTKLPRLHEVTKKNNSYEKKKKKNE